MKTVRVLVEIQVSDDGQSAGARHRPATQEDVDTLTAMRFGGQDVVATALLGEAIRRDAMLRVGIVHATSREASPRVAMTPVGVGGSVVNEAIVDSLVPSVFVAVRR